MSEDLKPSWAYYGNTMNVIRGRCDGIYIYGSPERFLESFNAAPRWAGDLFAAFWCDAEVRNGGFHQFFSNSTGILAPEAIAGFKAIGLSERASMVEQAVSLFGVPFPRDREHRGNQLAALERPGRLREEWDPFHNLDELYYRAHDVMWERMDRYAISEGSQPN